jgi:hypothetical protein
MDLDEDNDNNTEKYLVILGNGNPPSVNEIPEAFVDAIQERYG